MFVIVSSAEFVLCHREEHKTLLYITSNSLALDTSLIPEGQTFQSHAYSQLQATYSRLAVKFEPIQLCLILLQEKYINWNQQKKKKAWVLHDILTKSCGWPLRNIWNIFGTHWHWKSLWHLISKYSFDAFNTLKVHFQVRVQKYHHSQNKFLTLSVT